MQVTNPYYGLVIDRLHLYYDMQLVTFGINKDKNLFLNWGNILKNIHLFSITKCYENYFKKIGI